MIVEQVIAMARATSLSAHGRDDDKATIETLARMVIVASASMSAGHARIPPQRKVSLALDQHEQILTANEQSSGDFNHNRQETL